MSFLSDPIGNISGAISNVGKGISGLTKNPLVDALAGAALMSFAPEMMGSVGSAFGAAEGTAGATALGAGLTTGGIATLASGNLADGFKAGLAGYGGAGAQNYLANMGTAAAAVPSAAETAGNAAITNNVTLGSGVTNPISATNLTGGLTGGGTMLPAAATNAGSVASSIPSLSDLTSGLPSSWQGVKDLASKYWYVSAPLGLAAIKAAATPQKINPPAAKVGNIRQYSYNPYTGQMTAGPVTPANQFTGPVTAANYGATGGLVALARGGAVKHYDGSAGSVVQADPATLLNSSVAALANPGASNVSAFQALAQSDPAAYNAAITNAVQAAQAQYGGNNAQSQAAIANEMNQWGVNTAGLSSAIGAPISTVQADYNAVAPTGQYATTNLSNAGNSAVTNPEIVAAVQAASAPGGGGWASLQNQMINSGTSVTQAANALGMTPQQFLADYQATTGVQGEGTNLGPAPTNNTLGSSYDQQWANYMNTAMGALTNPTAAIQQMSEITGIPQDQIQQRYAAAMAAQRAIATGPNVLQSGTQYMPTYNGSSIITPTTNAPIASAPSTTLAPGVGGNTGPSVQGGGTTINPNGSITTSPVIPGIPAGGFTGAQNMRDMYTQRGGSLGYTSPVVTSMDQFNKEYNTLTGGSQAAYDFLMGKTTQPRGPANGPVAIPYFQAVGMAPKTTQYKLTNGMMATPQSDGSFLGADGNKYNLDGSPFTPSTTKAAHGGLMGLAGGGISVGHLGGYSDGGRLLRGPGDGVSDSIPATIGSSDPEPARLADGEFVVPARIVSELGNGSTEAGARQLYKMMDRIQNARRKTTGKDAIAANTNAHQYLPA